MFLCFLPKIYLTDIIGAQIFELSLNCITSCFGSPFSRKVYQGLLSFYCHGIMSVNTQSTMDFPGMQKCRALLDFYCCAFDFYMAIIIQGSVYVALIGRIAELCRE